MTDYKTLRVPESAWEQARESKRENETWGEFLRRCSDNPPEIREFVEATDATSVEGGSTDTDREVLAEDRQRQLEEVVSGMCGDHATEESVGELATEIRKAQELAEQARDEAQEIKDVVSR